MPMPQVCAQPGDTDYPGYILKNFAYGETIRFNDQQAYFAQGPTRTRLSTSRTAPGSHWSQPHNRSVRTADSEP